MMTGLCWIIRLAVAFAAVSVPAGAWDGGIHKCIGGRCCFPGIVSSHILGVCIGLPHCICAFKSPDENARVGGGDAEVFVEERLEVADGFLFVLEG